MPLAGFVLACSQRMVLYGIHLKSEAVNLNISYELPRDAMVANAMAGGPMFFSNGPEHGCPFMDLPPEDLCKNAPPVAFSQDETHGHNLLPRICRAGPGPQRERSPPPSLSRPVDSQCKNAIHDVRGNRTWFFSAPNLPSIDLFS